MRTLAHRVKKKLRLRLTRPEVVPCRIRVPVKRALFIRQKSPICRVKEAYLQAKNGGALWHTRNRQKSPISKAKDPY